jgi:hypothetical protein
MNNYPGNPGNALVLSEKDKSYLRTMGASAVVGTGMWVVMGNTGVGSRGDGSGLRLAGYILLCMFIALAVRMMVDQQEQSGRSQAPFTGF